MSGPPHLEKHFMSSQVVRDIVIGVSDGLTVPFALAAGLTGAVAANQVIVTAGVAEIVAGAIAMGLGGFLAAKTEADHYVTELQRERREIVEVPDRERDEVAGLFREYGLTDQELEPVLRRLAAAPDKWADFMMKFELGLEAPDPKRAVKSAFVISSAYVAGGAIPLMPYVFLSDTMRSLVISATATLVTLFVFGAAKGRFTGVPLLKSGLQTLAIGGIAAAAAFFLARALGG
jgi:VIT1/CCC1 family predicted Fe2+/Mn2+ transporter